ncbi:N-acetylmuramoyl-L-alanine amidase family protein [Flavobacterium degerlachei]|jgi:N-acetylmuramoyl-L-alanine amidase|uniref:N-acetylmuramoyl-L-alanine amidase n=1 Tax=Flavobacterium degerlachei TaxID=229203 RepID=A0A1H3FFF1_9FLAO|nr:N-acetylmuramoyl-L-alanine amidase [Flavobacterium degerlachei]SDX88874.1 N-acetylmuramoyl-L-alanine amidase [Flavobacterium degerlachei]
MKFNYYSFFLIPIFILFNSTSAFSQNDQTLTVVLDAGHGGKDPGNSYHGFTEKVIALKTALKVGSILEKTDGFKIIYTRTSDVFIELANRPKIANKANANLFVSIHCNSVKNFQPYGTETFVMGLSRSDLNLEVAKRENSVILLEDNFKDTYQGFDPSKPESLIGLTILQEENLNNSIILATEIQDNFTNKLNRNSRGIKQQPLWVLDAVYMPSVLIELGFLSNKEEGEFLNSEEGQDQMALQIANAIVQYKKKYFGA